MWQQNYIPLGGSLPLSALVASLPLLLTLVLLAVAKKPAWISALSGLGCAAVVALVAYGMPVPLVISTIGYGAANGLLPIAWIVFTAILMYRMTVETGKFEIIKDSIGHLTKDRRLQALVIAFAFGAFIEGASGFGTPVAVAAAMLAGLGFEPFYAAAICLIANTAPVAFGALGAPLLALQTVTGLPMETLSSDVGRICAPLSTFVPVYLILVMGGVKALKEVWPAALVCGFAFGGMQFLVSNFVGPQLTDILGSLTALVALVVLLKIWKPEAMQNSHPIGELAMAWSPYIFLVICVLIWAGALDGIATGLGAAKGFKPMLESTNIKFDWWGLHNQITRVAPVVAKASPYAAQYTFNPIAASGSACLVALFFASFVLRYPLGKLVLLTGSTIKQLTIPTVTIMSVVGLAYVMNYSGATATLGLAFAATGAAFPFFSALLGWLGVFLTGSDTSANTLFGPLQVVTANTLHLNAGLMAASNSSGGVMAKMISLQSLAVAAAATGMSRQDETRLFRFTIRHSVVLTTAIGVVVLLYAYVFPDWVK